jgi:hypothetical protein
VPEFRAETAGAGVVGVGILYNEDRETIRCAGGEFILSPVYRQRIFGVGEKEAGGVLIATRRLPAIAPGNKATAAEQIEFKTIAGRLFNGSNRSARFVEREEDLGSVLTNLLKPDLAIAPSAKDFGFVHRRTDDADIYFVANTSNQKRSVQLTFRAASASVEICEVPLTAAMSVQRTPWAGRRTVKSAVVTR